VRRETAQLLLPTRRRVDLHALVTGAAGARLAPWRWRPRPVPTLARAERTADGAVHLVTVRVDRGRVRMRVVGRAAGEAEILAPLAARMRRALGLDARDHGLRGTTAFEDAALALCAARAASLLALGQRCPVAPGLRTFPSPGDVAAAGATRVGRVLGSARLGRRLHALARALATAPAAPTRS
jgi:hypothetical protein